MVILPRGVGAETTFCFPSFSLVEENELPNLWDVEDLARWRNTAAEYRTSLLALRVLMSPGACRPPPEFLFQRGLMMVWHSRNEVTVTRRDLQKVEGMPHQPMALIHSNDTVLRKSIGLG